MILIIGAVIVGSLLLWNYAKPEPVSTPIATNEKAKVVPSISAQQSEKQHVFVPYWTFTKNIVTDSEYSLIYFGVAINEKGLETSDRGYESIASFIRFTPNARERILAIRMLDKSINAKILKDSSLQEKIATDAVTLAKKYDFDGILLDYETSAFGFESTTNNITSLYKLFSNKARSQNMLFYVSLYGDTYFQSRPYDVKQISIISDKVLIMAYDFSKSRGNPGPNFPLVDINEYGYDFGKMISDFQKDVDNQKLIVTLGYFGYDWRVNGKGESVTNGVPLSTNEIEKEFIDECEYKECKLTRNGKTSEPSISYTDEGGEDHIIWFEDDASVSKKIEFLKTKGILEIASWAYSYY
ncbi:MAG: glycosyl hydrolase family 18 protein [Candidatus Levybacteria bacterium]|nr:glycosyl hydrolase family 18 protein [Candidatus Levybacteria bacterium]